MARPIDNAVSDHMRAGLWHIVGASGWLGAEAPDSIQQGAINRVRAFGGALRALVPASGAYLNENDWAEPDWQASFFGSAYGRLLRIKRAVDPTGVFTCHQCVGSELAFA